MAFLLSRIEPTAAQSTQTQAPYVQTEYGFTGVLKDSSSTSINAGHAMADQLAAHDAKWLRIGINISIINYNSPTDMIFNEEDWTSYVDLYNYAKSKGLKIYLNTYPAYELTKLNLSDEDFLKAVSFEYEKLARTFPQADAWQIYNEANWSYKDDYSPICQHAEFNCINGAPTSLPAPYMEKLKKTIMAASSSIKSINPSALITTNAAGANSYAINYMNYLQDALDMEAFDIYPSDGDRANNFSNLKATLSSLKNAFGDRVWIAETGRPSSSADCSYQSANANEQKNFFLDLIPAYAEYAIKHIFIYEYQDIDTAWVPECEKHFGVIDRRYFEKPSFTPLMQMLNLYAYMPLQGSTNQTSQALHKLFSAFQDAFGRPPTTWEAYGSFYSDSSWLNATINQNLSYDQIMAQNQNWLMSPAGASERKDVVMRSYQNAFGRSPFDEELQSWSSANFGSYANILAAHINWLGSPEGENERAATIRRSYETILGREPFDAELSAWMSASPQPYFSLIESHRNWADYNLTSP